MNTFLWILQSFTAFVFLYSGINKSIFSERKLVASGQTGVEGLPLPLIRFIGISELFGVVGLILPTLLNIYPILTPVAALCLATIMVLAARIHYRRGEYKSMALNCVVFMMCVVVAWGRAFFNVK